MATAAPATRTAQSHTRGDMFTNSALSSNIDPEDVMNKNNPNSLEAGFRVYGKNAGNNRQYSNDISKVRNRMRLSKITDPNANTDFVFRAKVSTADSNARSNNNALTSSITKEKHQMDETHPYKQS